MNKKIAEKVRKMKKKSLFLHVLSQPPYKTVRFTGVSLLNIFKQKINFDCSFVTFKYHLRKYLINNDVNG